VVLLLKRTDAFGEAQTTMVLEAHTSGGEVWRGELG
jgi:hypothetical protein